MAGAPRTTMTLMASATSSQERKVRYFSSVGRRRWSIMRTPSSDHSTVLIIGGMNLLESPAKVSARRPRKKKGYLKGVGRGGQPQRRSDEIRRRGGRVQLERLGRRALFIAG